MSQTSWGGGSMKGNTWGLGVTGIQTPAKEKPPGFSVFQVGKFPPHPLGLFKKADVQL